MSTQNNLVIVIHSAKQYGAQINKLIIYNPLKSVNWILTHVHL
jgi:hypothetical protein